LLCAAGDGERAGELFHSEPVTIHRHAPDYTSTRSSLRGVAMSMPCRPHGRGGWTGTRFAGWMYRAGLESILGFKLQGERLMIDHVCRGVARL